MYRPRGREEARQTQTNTKREKEIERERDRKKEGDLEMIRTLALRGAHSSTPLRLIHNMDPVYFAYFML
jgi:hypothetical protein